MYTDWCIRMRPSTCIERVYIPLRVHPNRLCHREEVGSQSGVATPQAKIGERHVDQQNKSTRETKLWYKRETNSQADTEKNTTHLPSRKRRKVGNRLFHVISAALVL